MISKYSFEAGLNVYFSSKALIPAEHIQSLKYTDKHQYHIYAILAYDKYYFRKDKTCVTKDGISTTVFTVTSDGEKEYNLPLLPIADDIDYDKVKIDFVYPYEYINIGINDINFLNNNPKFCKKLTISANDLFNKAAQYYEIKPEFEVLYIGQSYGKSGSRTAVDRLLSHSTFQNILMEVNRNYQSKSIYILLLEIASNLNMLFIGANSDLKCSDDESNTHMKSVLSDLPKEKQVINITEAALIYYFKPVYNERLINNFPNRNSIGYRQYFNLDYNALSIEMDLEFDDFPTIQLFTRTARADSSIQFIKFNLHNEADRMNMYDIFSDGYNAQGEDII